MSTEPNEQQKAEDAAYKAQSLIDYAAYRATPKPTEPSEPSAEDGVQLDRYNLGTAILRAWKKHGNDSWCSVADEVLPTIAAYVSSRNSAALARVAELEAWKEQHDYQARAEKAEAALAEVQRNAQHYFDDVASLQEQLIEARQVIATNDQKELQRAGNPFDSPQFELRAKLSEAQAQLTRAREELEAERGRLDWLEQTRAEIDCEGPGFVVYTADAGLGYGASKGAHKTTLRAAIDAAMSPAQPITPQTKGEKD